jgi:hypothetical protein
MGLLSFNPPPPKDHFELLKTKLLGAIHNNEQPSLHRIVALPYGSAPWVGWLYSRMTRRSFGKCTRLEFAELELGRLAPHLGFGIMRRAS